VYLLLLHQIKQKTIVQEVAHKLAMHVVGALPKYLDASSVPSDALAAERALLREQAARTGKPPAIVDKMVEGRITKYYEDVCLLDQPFIMDDKVRVRDIVGAAGRDAGVDLAVTGFVRVQVGEGMEEEGKRDFATEVADTLQQAAS
jgi:elongation factor Ts